VVFVMSVSLAKAGEQQGTSTRHRSLCGCHHCLSRYRSHLETWGWISSMIGLMRGSIHTTARF